MKAKIITQAVYEGGIAFVHGSSFRIKRIFVPEANNLVITPHRGDLYVWDRFEMEESCEIDKEIDIPVELVERAIDFLNSKKFLIEKSQEIIGE